MTEISRRRLVSDSNWSILAAIFNSVFGIIYFIVIGNYWSASGIGIFSLCLSLYFIASLLFNLGIHNAVIYEIAASGQDRRCASSFAYTAMADSLLLGVLGSIAGIALSPLIAAVFHQPQMTAMIRLFAYALPLFLINKTAMGILNAHRRMRFIAGVNIIRGGTILLYLISTAIFKAGLDTIPYGFVLAEFLIAILLLAACIRTHNFAAPSLQHSKRLVSFGWKAGLSGIIGDLNARLDVLVIGIFWDASTIGLYSIASAFAKGLWLIPGAVQNVTNPLVVQLYTSGEKQKLHRTIDVLLRLGTSLFTVIGIVVIVYIKPVIHLCYPLQPDMLGAAMPLYFLLPGTVIFTAVEMLGSAPSTSIGKPENAIKLISIIFGSNLLMNLALIPRFAALGAAAATSLSLLLGLAYFSYLCKKHLEFAVPLVKLFLLFFVFGLITASAPICESLIPSSVLLILGLAAITGTLAALKMLHKSDWTMICEILRSFSRPAI
jgi:O-antigen/teichoic acid export membrane protein